MAILINVHHYFHTDEDTSKILKAIKDNTEKILKQQGDLSQLAPLAADIKKGNEELQTAISKDSGNIAQP